MVRSFLCSITGTQRILSEARQYTVAWEVYMNCVLKCAVAVFVVQVLLACAVSAGSSRFATPEMLLPVLVL